MAVNAGHAGTSAEADAERSAAFAIQIQLSTRVGARTLGRDEGILREALTSLHAMFAITRGVLAEYDLAVGRPAQLRTLTERMLDEVLRPFLDRWHPALTAYEEQRGDGVDPVAHERAWVERAQFRTELRALAGPLTEINEALAEISGTDLEPGLPVAGAGPDNG